MAVNQEKLEYRKANNLCPRDGRPNVPGRKLCEKCLKAAAIKTKRYKDKQKSAGNCVNCGGLTSNNNLCDTCGPKANAASAKSQLKHYQSCKDNGVCVVCGNMVENEKTLCGQCLDDKTRYQKDRSDSFVDDNKCCVCGNNDPIDGGKRCQICIDKRNEWYQGSTTQTKDKVRRDENRAIVLTHYGGKCVECNESKPTCLAIDHIEGGGNTHRKKIGKYGSGFFKWLIDNDFPEGFQILCHNCNMDKYLNAGICPHKVRILQ